jgi:hypothetical protein
LSRVKHELGLGDPGSERSAGVGHVDVDDDHRSSATNRSGDRFDTLGADCPQKLVEDWIVVVPLAPSGRFRKAQIPAAASASPMIAPP